MGKGIVGRTIGRVYGTKVPRGNGDYMDYRRRSTDTEDQPFISRYGKVAYAAGIILVFGISLGVAFAQLSGRLDRVECSTKMLVDVIVYKQAPKQPLCL